MFRARLILAVLLLPFLVGGLGQAQPSESHVVRIREAGKLDLRCFPQTTSPFLAVNLEQGPMKAVGDRRSFKGLDVEIMTHVADHLGVELQIRPIHEPSLPLMLQAISSADGDIAGGGLTITEPRKEHTLFSHPYLSFFPAALVRADHHPSVKDLSRLRVSVLRGSSYDEAFRSLGIPDSRYLLDDFNTGLIERLLDNTTDVIFFDSCGPPEELGYSMRTGFRLNETHFLGYAMPLGSDLKAEVDVVLKRLEASGELDRLAARYLGCIQPDGLPVIEPEDFCAAGDCRP